MNLTKRPKKQTRASLKKGDTVAGVCPVAGFESVFFADDIDWTDHGGASISEETARALVGVVSPSTVQAAADVAGGRVVEAWRVQTPLPKNGTSAQRDVDWSSVPLGKMPDLHIARILGVTTGAVRGARVRRGIPTFTEDILAIFKGQPLGKVEDQEIATALGVPKPRVWRARLLLGIPPFNAHKSSILRDRK